MTKIEELKNQSPQQRADTLARLFQKNYKFFAKRNQVVARVMQAGPAPFHIDVTDDFLTVLNTETGELCHPSIGLDRFSETLGDWTNNAWVDLIEGRILGYKDHGKYSLFPERFQKDLFSKFPGLARRMQDRCINLPTLPNGKHFSNPVIFLGVFHGLHIDYYLSRTQLCNAAFIEPDPARFVLSCYFLDYQELEQRFGTLILNVGDELLDRTAEIFFNKTPMSGAVWVRVLRGYASDKFESLMRKFRLRWRRPYDVWLPAEFQIKGFRHTMENIVSGSRMLAKKAALSPLSRIAVVGSGPSLKNDLAWLKDHQDQLVVFSAHSAVAALQKSGIIPDFQFSLDICEYDEELFGRLQLNESVPIVTVANDIPDKFKMFADVFRIPETGGVYPVAFENSVPFLTPTTGNMALAFACWCKPSDVYLFGLDFGFREAKQTHVEGGTVYQTADEHRSAIGSGHLPVEANFGGEDVVTQSYFNLARLCASQPITNVAGQVRVWNCSDGARIGGAVPCRSGEIEEFSSVYEKSLDVGAIRSMFQPLKEGVHWHPLTLDGETQLEELKRNILLELKMKKFNWLQFVEKIDNFWPKIERRLPKKVGRHLDARIVPYKEVVNLLLITWYRLLCFTNNEEEWQQVYNVGYSEIVELFQEMVWDL